MLNIQDFETVLKKMLEYEHPCEGEVGNIKMKKDISWHTKSIMSKGLVGRLSVYISDPSFRSFGPRRIKVEDIEPLLKEGEKIEAGYKRFTPEGEEIINFCLKLDTKHEHERFLTIDSEKFSLFIYEKEGKHYIPQRGLEIIKAYLKTYLERIYGQ